MTTLTHRPSALVDQFEAAFTEIDGQVYVSQTRCVDILLDLYTATHDDVVRHVLSDGLNEIRHVNLVRASDMRACLLLAAAVEAPGPRTDQFSGCSVESNCSIDSVAIEML